MENKQSFIPVEVTKTVSRSGVEYAHITGTHGLEMWVPTSELVKKPDETKEIKKAPDTKDVKKPDETKEIKKAPDTKDVKKPDETK